MQAAAVQNKKKINNGRAALFQCKKQLDSNKISLRRNLSLWPLIVAVVNYLESSEEGVLTGGNQLGHSFDGNVRSSHIAVISKLH
jgi:hypothetical protein